MLLCKNCGPRPVSEFRKHHRRGYQNQCISCRAAYNREHYKRNKQRYLDRAHRSNERYREYVISKLCSYLREHPCRVCGEADAAILEFRGLLNRRCQGWHVDRDHYSPLLGTGQGQVAGSTIASVRRAGRDPFTLAARSRFHGRIGKWQAGSLQNCNREFDSHSCLKTWPSAPATRLAP